MKKQEVRSNSIRNAVKKRAGEFCESCGIKTFLDKKGGFYLEVHHIDLISEGGKDTEENACAICPNCHSRIHYGLDGDEFNSNLKIKIWKKQDKINMEKKFKSEMQLRPKNDPLSKI